MPPACSPPRAGGMGEGCSRQQQQRSPLYHPLHDKRVSGQGEHAPCAWELLSEGQEALFVGLLLPLTGTSGQSNPSLNCSSAALFRKSKDSLLEMDVVTSGSGCGLLNSLSSTPQPSARQETGNMESKSVVSGTDSSSGNMEVTPQPPEQFALLENGNLVRSTHPHAVGRSWLPHAFTALCEAPVLPARRSGLLSNLHGTVSCWLWG